jgi:hypothetical protein
VKTFSLFRIIINKYNFEGQWTFIHSITAADNCHHAKMHNNHCKIYISKLNEHSINNKFIFFCANLIKPSFENFSLGAKSKKKIAQLIIEITKLEVKPTDYSDKQVEVH